MKILPWILVVILSVALLWPREKAAPEVKVETRTITKEKVDTFWMVPHMALLTRVIPGETIYVRDTFLLREQSVYKDSNYIAYVSGYQPRLDSLIFFPKTITNYVYETVTLTPKPKRWSIGPQVGYGLQGGYVGIGIQYSLFQW